MKKRFIAIITLWILVDIYFFMAVLRLTMHPLIYLIYWLIEAVVMGALVYSVTKGNTNLLSRLMAPMLVLFVPKLFGSIILLLEDITRLFRGFPVRSYAVSEIAVLVSALLFLILLYGITRGRHHYKVHKVILYFSDLPKAFDGFRITQLSDIHAGSFIDKKGVQKGIDLVNAQKSDLILFTGDLVNNQATEMDPWIPVFSQLKAPYGKYSILGNHDYGDYMRWENEELKLANLNRLKEIHCEIGFQLLLNESRRITKQGDSIELIGVENWGKGGFHKYGDLDKAIASVPNNAFKILMSHDPSHWEAIILDHPQPIHLTLSGHTHGMQFGFEVFGIKWSPIKYMYKQWAGLYVRNNQYLYVNRGFGFLGLKGRVGIWPEITVITLKCK
ncbi:metallophosphoesterase [Arachidicoccus ginsenosidivorans]|uniref:Metallophosphoesterase n=2 Tax=Arachidicoccus ginsenosidivorans TaxID=496057 RepID=A0A5B8VPV2_9BACT|nr:metallophosphoesterase [Arachidicoccus ginsenosidivorans]